MVVFATILFSIALVALGALFLNKHWEVQAGRVLVPNLREKGDERALALKDFLEECRVEARTWPPKALIFGRSLTRRMVLGVAQLARSTEARAHALADRLSHKHEFQRRTSANEFLKQMGDLKSGEGDTSARD